MKNKVVIIGAGLTGLTLAYYLKKHNVDTVVLEARSRIGGRIHTLYTDQFAPVELGATWLGKKHTSLSALLKELGLSTFVQILGSTAIYEPISTSPPQLVQLPPNDEPSFRIKGGSSLLINTLRAKLGEKQVLLNQAVKSINSRDKEVIVTTNSDQFSSNFVVSTLPPYLLSKTIKITPPMPEALDEIVQQTHTWMGESIKIAIRYAKPFWRAAHISGTIFSNVGPITEFYDHSDADDNYYALKGFMNGAYQSATQDQRMAAILKQLNRLIGPESSEYMSYHEAVWAHEPYTYHPYTQAILPHQNNGHKIFNQPILNNRFIISGSETAGTFPGYMDGAVQSAQTALSRILDEI